MNAAISWAQDSGYSEMTLTTFREIPWNAPAYERFGFRQIEVDASRAELKQIQKDEAETGFALKPRVSMNLLF